MESGKKRRNRRVAASDSWIATLLTPEREVRSHVTGKSSTKKREKEFRQIGSVGEMLAICSQKSHRLGHRKEGRSASRKIHTPQEAQNIRREKEKKKGANRQGEKGERMNLNRLIAQKKKLEDCRWGFGRDDKRGGGQRKARSSSFLVLNPLAFQYK